MRRDTLFALLGQARALCGHRDYVVIGSLSILGLEGDFDIPDDMTLSVDVDCYAKEDPGRTADLVQALGENSAYHLDYGCFLDPVSPGLPSLPDGWADRLVAIEHGGVRAWFLDPNDAAISKYARGEPRDLRWIRAGIRAGVVSLPIVRARLRNTSFLDGVEQERARALVDDDAAWFEAVKSNRAK